MKTVDRIAFAVAISHGRKVLDIGGQKMAGCDPNSPFAKEYSKIERAASEYRIVDYQKVPTVDYVVDFNTMELSHNIFYAHAKRWQGTSGEAPVVA